MSSFSDLRKIGIIPTRMGTRLSAHNALRHLQDHPHAYGDKFGNYTAGLDKKGSSPRVWGQVQRRQCVYYVGKDHPHAYGDKYKKVFGRDDIKGSSPRVWGQGKRL